MWQFYHKIFRFSTLKLHFFTVRGSRIERDDRYARPPQTVVRPNPSSPRGGIPDGTCQLRLSRLKYPYLEIPSDTHTHIYLYTGYNREYFRV